MKLESILTKIKSYVLDITKNRLLLFFIISIIYMELMYAICVFQRVDIAFIYPVLFSISAGCLFTILSSIFKPQFNKIIAYLVTTLLGLTYCFYLVYFKIFKTTFSLYSFVGAKDALQFSSVIKSSIITNLFSILLFFIPLAIAVYFHKKVTLSERIIKMQVLLLCLMLFSFVLAIGAVQTTANKPNSQHSLYYKSTSPHLMVKKLGLLTTIRLDCKRLLLGFNPNSATENRLQYIKNLNLKKFLTKEPKFNIQSKYNVMDISFLDLLTKENNNKLLDMHKYFSSVQPSSQNKYTGLFKGHNLILITAEAFYPYAIDKDLTPTLYKLANEGFKFSNFYNPLWGVSTSDGEYAACTGLVPKAGVWSMSNSSKNDMRFTLGNQLRKLGYITKAYHNHTYNYYNRDISHPNLGYDYKGVGNGLKISPAWPESDLELIEQSTNEYIGDKPFHTYYMTVSGHFEYNFEGNNMSIKNKKYVEHLNYSDPAKAYLACNLEFEFALTELIKRLEEAGVADKTIIAISPDHYPYGLPKKQIDELSGHVIEENFELYKADFILWKKGMEQVIIDKPCSSIDILPTLSNLFGLKYDSRLLFGRDILSTAKPLVVFNNRSWITDKGKYNALTSQFSGSVDNEATYINIINNKVADIFNYSAYILETNYYSKVFKKNQ